VVKRVNSSSHLFFGATLFGATLAANALAHAAERVLVLDPGATKIRFVLEATLHNVEGSARLLEGKVQFDPESGSATGVLRVDARSATTGINARDATMHAEVLESGRFPEVVFVSERIMDARGTASKRIISVVGRIKIHGVEQPLTILIEAKANDQRVRLQGRFVIPYVQWGMKDVSTFLLRVGKTVEIQIDAVGTLDAPVGQAP
jgi:polyisoprenoid-binding protein YceI